MLDKKELMQDIKLASWYLLLKEELKDELICIFLGGSRTEKLNNISTNNSDYDIIFLIKKYPENFDSGLFRRSIINNKTYDFLAHPIFDTYKTFIRIHYIADIIHYFTNNNDLIEIYDNSLTNYFLSSNFKKESLLFGTSALFNAMHFNRLFDNYKSTDELLVNYILFYNTNQLRYEKRLMHLLLGCISLNNEDLFSYLNLFIDIKQNKTAMIDTNYINIIINILKTFYDKYYKNNYFMEDFKYTTYDLYNKKQE